MASPVTLVREDGTPIFVATDDLLISAWNGSAQSCTGYSSATVAFIGITGGDSYTVNGSLAGVVYKAISGISLAGFATILSVVADGLFAYPALGTISYTKTGTASTPTVNLLLKR